MPSFCRNDVVLVAYPFSDRSGVKVRPAVVVSGEHRSHDIFVVPLTSKTDRMIDGEFALADWHGAGLNVASVVKRGLYTIHESLVIKMVGRLGADDASRVDASLRQWLNV
ncbi:MAG: type II toxin-antitoxin system PemK/MazF family toxin [Planctomycetia bacterium]